MRFSDLTDPEQASDARRDYGAKPPPECACCAANVREDEGWTCDCGAVLCDRCECVWCLIPIAAREMNEDLLRRSIEREVR